MGGIAAGLVLLVGGVTATVAILADSDNGSPPAGSQPGAAPPPAAAPTTAPAGGPVPEIVTDGTGPGSVPLEVPQGAVAMATIVHQALDEAAPFIVNLVGTDGQEHFAVATNGSYSGSTLLLGPPSGFVAASLRIEATGTWSVHVQDLGEAPAWPVTDGDDDLIIRIEPGTLEGPVSVTATHADYFAVDAFTWAGNPTGEDFLIGQQLLVEFSGGTSSFEVPPDTAVLEISAAGEWSLDLS